MTIGRPQGCDGRRLRFGYELRADESIPGALIASLGPQWLDDARPVLEAAGLSARRPGTLGFASPTEARRLAWVMRCDPVALIARLGRKASDDVRGHGPVDFGGMVLPRRRFETARLRIAPGSLAATLHHRIAWFDRALPFCPASLERLVDTCRRCGLRLRWTGIGKLDVCGRCGTPIAASADPGLPATLADDYRGFAALSSPLPALRLPTVERLPARLSSTPHGLLSRLALQLGGLLHDPPLETTSPEAWTRIAAEDLARAVSSGWRMLEGWPDALTEKHLAAARTVGRDRATFERVRASLRRLAGPDEPVETRTLVLEALPDLAKHAGHSFAVGGRYYISREVARTLGLKTVDVPRVRTWPDLRFVPVPGLSRTLGHYDADQIDEVAALLRSSHSIESASWTLDLPVYGAEQLVAAGLLQHRDHGALVALGRDRHVSAPSVDQLQERIRSSLPTESAPASSIPLRLAMRNFGGGPKPWSAIVTAILRGDMPVWASGDRHGLQSLLVEDGWFNEAVDRLPRMDPVCGTMIPADTITQIDAGEILNLDHKSLSSAATELGIAFSKSGRGLAARLTKVEAVAARVVWEPELRRRLGCRSAELRRIMHRVDVPTIAGGWCRHGAVAAGLPATATLPPHASEAPAARPAGDGGASPSDRGRRPRDKPAGRIGKIATPDVRRSLALADARQSPAAPWTIVPSSST